MIVRSKLMLVRWIRIPATLFCLVAATPFASADDDAVRAECIIEPSAVIRLASATAGLIAEMPVERGDHITAGQVVARLESRAQEVELELARLRASSSVDLEIAEARLSLSQARADRVEQLFQRDVAPEEQLQELIAERQLASLEISRARFQQQVGELEKQRAKELLALRSIRSPIDGIVEQKLLSVGEFVHQEAPLMQVSQIDPLYVEAYLPAALYPTIEQGMTASVYTREPVEGEYDAVITIVDQVLDAASGTFGVRLELPNPDGTMLAGVRCSVIFNG